MEVAEDYEIKFHNYNGNERDFENFIIEYQTLREAKRNEGNVNSKVQSYFFDGIQF
ncbi:MAG: hypothetical protein ACW99A_18815 [Candidatus Kariarchaeaceae archaeon]